MGARSWIDGFPRKHRADAQQRRASRGNAAAPAFRDLAVGVLQETLFSGYDIYALACYPKALTDAEILQAYNALKIIAAPTTPRTVVFEGTSITSGPAALSYAYSFGANANPSVHGVVAAVSGANLANLVSRAAALDAIIATGPTQTRMLSVEIGANDLGISAPYNANPNGFITALISYLDARRAAGWKVVLHTILPRTEAGQTDGGASMNAKSRHR
jgi:hypothetical protein